MEQDIQNPPSDLIDPTTDGRAADQDLTNVLSSESNTEIDGGSKKFKYSNVSNKLRIELVNCVILGGENIKQAAIRLGINYSTAKSICQTYKKEGRLVRKPSLKRAIEDEVQNLLTNNEGLIKHQQELKDSAISDGYLRKKYQYSQAELLAKEKAFKELNRQFRQKYRKNQNDEDETNEKKEKEVNKFSGSDVSTKQSCSNQDSTNTTNKTPSSLFESGVTEGDQDVIGNETTKKVKLDQQDLKPVLNLSGEAGCSYQVQQQLPERPVDLNDNVNNHPTEGISWTPQFGYPLQTPQMQMATPYVIVQRQPTPMIMTMNNAVPIALPQNYGVVSYNNPIPQPQQGVVGVNYIGQSNQVAFSPYHDLNLSYNLRNPVTNPASREPHAVVSNRIESTQLGNQSFIYRY